jgi:tetraacyldisaccharide 4'-kinase
MIFLKILLSPFSLLYCLVTSFRNHLFNIGYTKSFHFDTKVINVGNLSVGGTGKTPHVEYLVRLIKEKYKVATLSRGYGRRSKGFILADEKSDPFLIGDEPMQFYTKFSGEITVAVGEERALAIPQILYEKPETRVIILDDAYQHRTVVPDLNILLTEYHKPFYEDMLLPAGRLRESKVGAKRADIVIVTKCPKILESEEMKERTAKIHRYAKKDTPVFYSSIHYKEPAPVYPGSGSRIGKNVLLFSGIADATTLKNKVQKEYNLVQFIEFPDHYKYFKSDIIKIVDQFNSIEDVDKSILTTEKDMVKLQRKEISDLLIGIPLFYIPIEIIFLNDKQIFDEMVFHSIGDKAGS